MVWFKEDNVIRMPESVMFVSTANVIPEVAKKTSLHFIEACRAFNSVA
jgi:hypothetical protein